MQTVAYKYTLGQPLDWGDDCESQFIKANQLWNKLVEIERQHIALVRATISDDETVADVNDKVDVAKAKVERLKQDRKDVRQKTRTKVSTPALDAAIREAGATLKLLYAALKAGKQASAAANKIRLAALSDARFEAVKRARQEAAANGLWWGNYNATVESFETAAIRARKVGAELQFRRYSGEGRLTNQIPGGMTVAELIGGEHSQVQLVKAPGINNAKRQYHLVVTACAPDRLKRMVRFQLIMHRRLPEDARIQMVVVHRRKGLTRFHEWSAVFNLRLDDAQPTCDPDKVVAVNFGWRKVGDGIRVATAMRGNHKGFVMLLPNMITGQEAGERNRGRIDDAINRMSGWLMTLDTQHANEKTQEVIAQLRSVRRLRGGDLEWLRRTWEIDSPKWQPDQLAELQALGRRWRRYRKQDAAAREWLKDGRQYHYRAEIRRLVGDAGVIVVNAHRMSETAKKEENDLPQAARHQRKLASPSLLRNVLIEHARKTGARIIVDEAAHDRCACHNQAFALLDRSKLIWPCPVSHLGLDQDVDHCRAMLNRFSAGETAGIARNGETAEKKKSFRPNRKRRRTDGEQQAP